MENSGRERGRGKSNQSRARKSNERNPDHPNRGEVQLEDRGGRRNGDQRGLGDNDVMMHLYIAPDGVKTHHR